MPPPDPIAKQHRVRAKRQERQSGLNETQASEVVPASRLERPVATVEQMRKLWHLDTCGIVDDGYHDGFEVTASEPTRPGC